MDIFQTPPGAFFFALYRPFAVLTAAVDQAGFID